MKPSLAIAALLLPLALAVPAKAQTDATNGGTAGGNAAAASSSSTSSASIMVPVEKDDASVPSLNLMAGQVRNLKVIGADGNEIGNVGEVLGDQNGTVRAIRIDVGGFLGIGEKNVILMLNDVKLDMGRLRTTLTKEQIQKLPDFQ